VKKFFMLVFVAAAGYFAFLEWQKSHQDRARWKEVPDPA
jgi:hypothetical protein